MIKNLEKKIVESIHEFDVISLLRLLYSMDYSPDTVRFRSNNSVCSQTGLIAGINFKQKPFRQVIITFNLGLLSAQSPLPGYFRNIMEQNEEDNKFFVNLCGYLDHYLIKDYLQNIYPEFNNYYFPDWIRAKQDYLNILNLKSSSALHWLFQLVFPEITVRVENAVLGGEIKTEAIHLGKTMLGDAVFGRKTDYLVWGRRVTLMTGDEMTYTQIPWPREIERRLNDLLFPVLRPIGIDLEIILVLKAQKRWVRLYDDSFLGYDRMKTDEDTYRSIRIFKGHIGEL
jgi:hypothetical protein